MADMTLHQSKDYKAIMLSSTFTDLKEHRSRAIQAIQKLSYLPRVMEYSGAQGEMDVIDTSLTMVRDAVAYIGVISLKYGQTPFDPERNPNQLSITELEFNEAMRLDRPIVLFIMSDEHSVKKADIESDPDRLKKLDAFRERAKRMRDGSDVHRIYEVFDSLEQFSTATAISIGRLVQFLESNPGTAVRLAGHAGGLPIVKASKKILASIEKVFGTRHPYTRTAARIAAYVLQLNGCNEEAAQLREKYRLNEPKMA